MKSTVDSIALTFMRLAAPSDGIGLLARFAAILAAIHLLSLLAECLLVGGIAYDPMTRLWITVLSGGPFLLMALYGFSLAAASRSRLRSLAMTDPLTELPNRRAFLELIDEARSRKLNGFLAILDADNFKRINDTLGHDAGDRALVTIARQMRALTGANLQFARLGGEEFGLLATGPFAADGVAEVERTLCQAIRFGQDAQDRPVSISLSGGVTCFEPGDTSNDLLRRADIALYRAKRLGRGRMALWCDLDEAAAVPTPPEPVAAPTHLQTRMQGAGAS